MIKQFIKTIWRNAIRHKSQTAINVIGLSLGLTCWLFIYIWVQNEKNIDNFHNDQKNLYAAYLTVVTPSNINSSYTTPIGTSNGKPTYLMDEIKQAIPSIKNISYYATGYDLPWGHAETFEAGNKITKFKGSRVSKDFFKIFSYPLVTGNATSALADMKGISISIRMAEIMFGSPENAMGKSLLYENMLTFVVSSVFENITNESTLKFDFLLNWDAQNNLLKWSSNDFKTFVQLSDNADPADVEKKITKYLASKNDKNAGYTLQMGLQPYGDQYLYNIFVDGKPNGGRIEYVKLFTGVAFFVLIIACINFMNLSTAKSVKRAKEIGVRKVIGSNRGQLIGLFFGESLFFSFIATLLSLIIVAVLLPFFYKLTNDDFNYPFGQLSFWISLTILPVITGIIAGIYPALYLSSLKPVRILKGVLRFSSGANWFRKGLTVFQFVLSIILIISTMVIVKQTNYVQNTHLGYDKENLAYIPVEGGLTNQNNYLYFKNEALKISGIKAIDRSSEAPHAMNFSVSDPIVWPGKGPKNAVVFKPASVGFDFAKVMNLQIVAGRNFSKSFPSDSTDAFIVNEEAVKQMQLKNPLGHAISAWKKNGHIVGVVKNYHTQSLHEPILPVVLDIKEGQDFGMILVRTERNQSQQALQNLAALYKSLNPKYPLSYQFADQEYAKLYRSEQIISKLSVAFAAIAILISCLGLLGLVLFSVEQRIKEFAVRKVLGASVSHLMTLFAKDYIKLVCLAFFIAAPVGWLAMYKWLQNFAYKTDISWWIFIFAGVGSIIITTLTLVLEAYKAAIARPAQSLRIE